MSACAQPAPDVWERVKRELAKSLTPESFRNWFEASTLRECSDHTVHVSVPNEAIKQFNEQVYGERVAALLRQMDLPWRQVVYHAGPSPAAPGTPPRPAPIPGEFNPRFTFAAFAVGPSNELAHCAAKTVAGGPTERYNPLLVYGKPGVGKTHLLQAIGRAVLENYPGMRVVYTPAEAFLNAMIEGIQQQRMADFRDRYRQADVLLVDDIQILGNRERLQDEFFHTFNVLQEHQKQIVMTGDAPPAQMHGLLQGLRSRFASGLPVEIKPPDLETRLAILARKADEAGIGLPEEVRIFAARHMRSDVRAIEGFVSGLAIRQVVHGTVSLPMAEEVLRALDLGPRESPRIDAVVRAVAARFGLQPSQLRERTNARRIVCPRQVAMYIAREVGKASLPEIGRAFGKNHATVLHAVRVIAARRRIERELDQMIEAIADELD